MRGYPPGVVLSTSRIGLVRIDPGATVVEIDGDHDLRSVARLRGEVERILDEGAAIVVDLELTTFVDSSMLAGLLDARRAAERRELGFAVNMPSDGAEAVQRVIEITGLGAALPIFETREEAVAAVRAERS